MNKIKFIALDVDGVCTDNKVYYSADGSVSKSFNTQDGLAITTAIKLNMGIGIITGRKDEAVAKRAADLGITDYYPNQSAKLKAMELIMEKYGLTWDEMAFVGDDWIDIDPMKKSGYAVAVANACPLVKGVADYVTKARGGEGAVREAILHIFEGQGKTVADFANVWIHPS